MKLYILNTGYLETDKNSVVACAKIGTRSNPNVQNEWIKLPVMSFLIETDDGEYILFDTGSNPEAMKGYWQNTMQEIYPLYQTEDQKLENQLTLCGVKPEDIKKVILSHMHLDHAGNLQLFPHADVYVPKADYLNGLAAVHMTPDRERHGGYIKGDMIRPAEYKMVTGEFEIVPGVDVISLPGHTEDLLGLVVHLEGGTIILPQDCIYTSEIYGPPVKLSGLLFDSVSFIKSVEKVRSLAKKYDAKVIFAHDWEFFQTLDLAPKYYE